MKKLTLTLLSLICFMTAWAQFPKDLYKKSEVVWYGIDYTKCRLIGADGFNDPEKIVNYYFNTWNRMIDTEPKKYDVSSFLHKVDMKFNLTMLRPKNKQVNPDNLWQENISHLDYQSTEMIKNYKLEEKAGIGAVFIAEHYSKRNSEASYIFVLFDINSRDILFKKTYTSEPGGFGFRNYWAYTFYYTLKMINKDMKKWLK